MTPPPFKAGDVIVWCRRLSSGDVRRVKWVLLADPYYVGGIEWRADARSETGALRTIIQLHRLDNTASMWWEYDEQPVVSNIDGDW